MKYLLDTCVISEIFKPQPNENVVTWMRENDEESMYLSVLTFGEITKGIEKASSLAKKKTLQMWLENELKERFKHRILDIDMAVASQWGTIQGKAELAGKLMPTIDGLIAVSGLVHNCIVVTRNISDMQQSGVTLLNPWE
ncbi:MAG: type II toxin-antitoxin system VapC family toxin [Anaerolineae bacterium]|jgi:toxin FitB